MNKRTKVLVLAIPMLAIVVGVITTLSLPTFTLTEQLSLYDLTYEATSFVMDDIKVKYYDADELIVKFYLSGGDGVKDLSLEFICRDMSKDHINATASGTMYLEAVGAAVTNSTTIHTGDLVVGVLHWDDVPSGNQVIKAVISLDNIVIDTESFFVDIRE